MIGKESACERDSREAHWRIRRSPVFVDSIPPSQEAPCTYPAEVTRQNARRGRMKMRLSN